jgi:type 1 glutamine amidotransferase
MQGQQTHRSTTPPASRRRRFLGRLTVAAGILVVGAGVASALLPSEAPAPAGPSEKNVLFVYGGWPGHEPVQCRDLFVPWLESLGWDVTVSDTLDVYADEDLMGSVDLVIQVWTMDTIGKKNLAGLLQAVRGGVGLAGWHGGLGDAYRQETEYQFMVGGQWVAHPGNVMDYTVEITDQADPITAGLSDFKMHSEQYYMHVDPNSTVLATTTFSGKHAPWIDKATMPVVWKKAYGKGRVFYTSLGHVASDFEVSEAMTIMQRGILWASESRHASTPNLVAPVYPGR